MGSRTSCCSAPSIHDVIDADLDAYTIERLMKMKVSHESGPAIAEASDEVVDALLAISNTVTEGSIITAIGQSGGQVAHKITNLQPVFAAPPKRALVQVSFSWRESESKDKPFIIANKGDDEARNVQIHPIVLDRDRSFCFASVGQLLPNGPVVEREPQPDHEVGMYFRTLIDGIEMAANDRRRERKASILPAANWMEQLDQHIRAEQSALDDFENIPVTVTYENREGIITTLRYRLETTMFASLTKAELHFVGEGEEARPAPTRTATR